jgi:uncharacterized protein (UPF0335 family)
MAKKSNGQATNEIDPGRARHFLSQSMGVYDKLDAERISYMNRCKAIRGELPEIYDQAKDAGIPVRALKAEIKIKLEGRKIEKCRVRQEAAMPEDRSEKELFDQLVRALGDFGELPLGAAAMSRAKPGDDDDEEDVRPRHLQEAERQRAENARNLKGIGKLEADAP